MANLVGRMSKTSAKARQGELAELSTKAAIDSSEVRRVRPVGTRPTGEGITKTKSVFCTPLAQAISLEAHHDWKKEMRNHNDIYNVISLFV